MNKEIQFEVEKPSTLEDLRNIQIEELKAQVQDYIEEAIVTYKADFVSIAISGKRAGYACIGTYGDFKNIILEYYLIRKYCNFSGIALKSLANKYDCKKWIVNTQDNFSMPLMLDLRFKFETESYIFSTNGNKPKKYKLGNNMSLETTKDTELTETYKLLLQDGFYTGGSIETVAKRIAVNELYSLRIDGKLIGVGFIGILARTPKYADIAMIIDRRHRHKGFGTLLVKALIYESFEKKLIPTALTDVNNKNSRRALQKAGFYIDGYTLLAQVQ